MPNPSNDRAARAERWQRIRAAMSEPALEAHDRKVRELRETRQAKRETDLKAKIDEAIQRALPGALSQAFTETAASSPLTESAPDGQQLPDRPLHELSLDEFRATAAAAWTEQGQAFQSPTWNPRRPMTIGELIAGRYEDDSAV